MCETIRKQEFLFGEFFVRKDTKVITSRYADSATWFTVEKDGDVLELTVYDAKLNDTQECFDKCIKTALYYFNLKTTEFESRIRDMIEVEI